MCKSEPTAQEAAEWGLTLEEASGGPVDVWPDHWRVADVFGALGTQWNRAGMQGMATGLPYAGLPVIFRLMGVPRSEWPAIFEDLRVMERTALAYMREQQE